MTKARLAVAEVVPGTTVRLEGRIWDITNVEVRPEGRRLVTLRNASRGEMLLELAELLSKPGLALVSAGIVAGIPPHAAAKVAGDEEAKRVASLVAILNEIETGYRSGSDQKAKSNEPRPEFDPERTLLSDRVKAMATHSGMGESTIWRHLRAYRERGVLGLFDERALRTASADRDVLDPLIVAAARQVVGANQRLSKRTREQQMEATMLLASESAAKEGRELEPPQKHRLQRFLRELERADDQHLPTKSRRSSQGRAPRLGDGFHADFYGEQVIFDTWNVDVLCIGDETGVEIEVVAIVGLDVFSGDPVAYDLYPVDSTAVDLSLLIHEMLMPEPWDPSFGLAGKWTYVGVPEELIIQYGAANGMHFDEASSKIPVNPTSVTLDQGSIYVSETALGALRLLGTSVFYARKGTGADKGTVERAFGSIGTEFAQWYGTYRGRHTGERGSDIEKHGRPTFRALRRDFRKYMRCEYRNTPRDRLRLPEYPDRVYSPAQFADLAMARGGLPLRIPDPALVIDLLKTHFCTVTRSGVSISNLAYWAPVLADFIRVPSPYGGKARGRYIVNVHPSDPTRAWFLHPHEHAWYPLTLTNALRPGGPMQSATDDWTSSLLLGRGGPWDAVHESSQALKNERRNQRLTETYTKQGRRKAKRDEERVRDRARRAEAALSGSVPGGDPVDPYDDLDPVEDGGSVVPQSGWRSFQSRALDIVDSEDTPSSDGDGDE